MVFACALAGERTHLINVFAAPKCCIFTTVLCSQLPGSPIFFMNYRRTYVNTHAHNCQPTVGNNVSGSHYTIVNMPNAIGELNSSLLEIKS